MLRVIFAGYMADVHFKKKGNPAPAMRAASFTVFLVPDVHLTHGTQSLEKRAISSAAICIFQSLAWYHDSDDSALMVCHCLSTIMCACRQHNKPQLSGLHEEKGK